MPFLEKYIEKLDSKINRLQEKMQVVDEKYHPRLVVAIENLQIRRAASLNDHAEVHNILMTRVNRKIMQDAVQHSDIPEY